jgi:hypothetical protein
MTAPHQGARPARAQRRLKQKLAERVDRVTQVDGLFFKRWPDRRHKPPPIPPGLSHTAEIEAHLRKAEGTQP